VTLCGGIWDWVEANGEAKGVGLAGDGCWRGAQPAGGGTYIPSVTCRGARGRPAYQHPSGGYPGCVPVVAGGLVREAFAPAVRCVLEMNSVALTVQRADAEALARRIRALAAHIVEACDRDKVEFWSSVSGHGGVSMSLDVLQWSLAGPETPPAGPVTANFSAPSLVTVDAPAPVTDPCVATASRRKVVGVDCV
jgi:hypothetical protein